MVFCLRSLLATMGRLLTTFHRRPHKKTRTLAAAK
jgi:hypothetical protein